MQHMYYNMLVTHIDPKVEQLQRDVDRREDLILVLCIVILMLFVAVALQRMKIRRTSGKVSRKGLSRLKEALSGKGKKTSEPVPRVVSIISPKDLLDPGLIFKYSLAKEETQEKTISIGQKAGNIKTYSTEIIDDHLTVYIRIIQNQRDRDIYELPDKITEEYQLDLRRDGKVLIYYEGLQAFQEMGSRERIYLKGTPDEAGDPTFASINPRKPIRFRIGDRLNQDGKFINGFFEFHLFTQDYGVKTSAGINKIEKNFLIRLYKIYPGYDTGAPTDEGLYPMIDPFSTGR